MLGYESQVNAILDGGLQDLGNLVQAKEAEAHQQRDRHRQHAAVGSDHLAAGCPPLLHRLHPSVTDLVEMCTFQATAWT